MDALSKEFLNRFYDTNLMIFGDRPETLRWSAQGQLMRYSFMRELFALEGSTVLDYGCGKGDFCGHLKSAGISVEYTGVDINPNLIKLAAQKHPEARFLALDIEEDEFDGRFDYVFICGVFNNNIDGTAASMRKCLSELYAHTKKSLVLIGLSTKSENRSHDLFYTDPDELCGYARQHITGDITLIEGRLGDDFALLLRARS